MLDGKIAFDTSINLSGVNGTNISVVELGAMHLAQGLHQVRLGSGSVFVAGVNGMPFIVDYLNLSKIDYLGELSFGTDPLDNDTDNDMLLDGTEVGLNASTIRQNGAILSTNISRFIPDADDGTTRTDPLDCDSDNDGLWDGWYDLYPDGIKNANETAEDANRNGRVEAYETDPNDEDTDDDNLTNKREFQIGALPWDSDSDDDWIIDSEEEKMQCDLDNDTKINALDTDSDGDTIPDRTEYKVVFRTIAAWGGYNTSGIWIEVKFGNTNDLTNFTRDAPAGWVSDDDFALLPTSLLTYYYSNGTTGYYRQITTPEGYAVYKHSSEQRIYIDIPGAGYSKYSQSGTAQSYSPLEAYALGHRERYNASNALSNDDDGDGIMTSLEIAKELNPADPDTDHDGLYDGLELFWWADSLEAILHSIQISAIYLGNRMAVKVVGNRRNVDIFSPFPSLLPTEMEFD